ncbi:MAG: aminotransferase class V-fold PLP-dependent enzyme [Sphaerochaetaceae bacterium]|nr:aminotransferase class V-fold PLP-dependent enzyme [Sphaerochaetaceae bacterium]
MVDYVKGKFFSKELQVEVKDRFLNCDYDPDAGRRIFFENAGGSLRLKAVNQKYAEIDSYPDCDSRKHERAKLLREKTLNGFSDLRIMFNAPKYGQIISETSSSKVMFTMVRTILENVPGTNCVVTDLDHPSVYDSMKYYAHKRGMEFRVARPNPETGGVDVKSILDLIDDGTALINIIYASNHTGAVLDLEEIVKQARKKKPGIFILVDAVQHMPHGIVDIEKTPVDGINFAAYKVFGCRGFGAGYISDRVAIMDHPGILGNLGDPWEIGGPAPAMYAAISEIVNHVCWIGSQFSEEKDRRKLYEVGMHNIEMHERALMHYTLEGSNVVKGLRHIQNVIVHFDRDSYDKRDFIMPVTFKNIHFSEAVTEYRKRGVIVYDRNDSNYYSVRSLHPFGLDGIIRVSPLHCHDEKDIEIFLKATEEIAHL